MVHYVEWIFFDKCRLNCDHLCQGDLHPTSWSVLVYYKINGRSISVLEVAVTLVGSLITCSNWEVLAKVAILTVWGAALLMTNLLQSQLKSPIRIDYLLSKSISQMQFSYQSKHSIEASGGRNQVLTKNDFAFGGQIISYFIINFISNI